MEDDAKILRSRVDRIGEKTRGARRETCGVVVEGTLLLSPAQRLTGAEEVRPYRHVGPGEGPPGRGQLVARAEVNALHKRKKIRALE